jgi:serine/threonine protein phosphatase PrpC
MSRSIGDWVAESVGVTPDPEILEYALTPDDRFIVLGSDGVFDFMRNEDIVKLVVPFWLRGDIQGAAKALGREARRRW